MDRHNLLNRQLKPTCKKLGLTRVSWHWLRHANATLLDAVGTPLGTVQAPLGHSSSAITRDVYLHSIPSEMIGTLKQLEAGRKAEDLAREIEVSKHTIYAWKGFQQTFIWHRLVGQKPLFRGVVHPFHE
jgi:hypothetical protein